MLERIRGKLREWANRPVSGTVHFGEVAVDIPDVRELEGIPFQNTALYLELSNEMGIKPLSLEDILSQTDRKVLDNSVLFDAPPAVGCPGNHWRIVDIDPQRRVGTLQLCSFLGGYDYHQMPPFEVSYETPMFTGLSHQEYEIDGEPAVLSEVAQRVNKAIDSYGCGDYPESVEQKGETIYSSNASGELHPLYGAN